MKKLKAQILTWYKRLLEILGFHATDYQVLYREEVPDDIKALHIYAIGAGKPWLAVLACPCGCKEIIQLSLLDADSPHWRLKIDQSGKPTLSPSVWRTRGCLAHFVLEKGKVEWCNYGRS